jgi:cytochrome b6-f complex iron-sulfur subunit
MPTRRDVLRAGALAGIGCLCPVAGKAREICCITPEIEPGSVTFASTAVEIDLDKALSLRQPGSSTNLIDNSRGLDIILVHAEPSRYCTLSGLCTHYPRPLTYLPGRHILQCNNFNHSAFDLKGKVVKGPATEPLRTYTTTRKDRILTVEL